MACYMYVGSVNAATGICSYRFDEKNGTAERLARGFLEIDVGHGLVDRERDLIYFTNQASENAAFPFGGGGEVYALKVDRENGSLSLFDKTISYGVHPAYAAFDREKRRMVVPHFTPPMAVATLVERDAAGAYAVKPVLSDSNTVLFEMREDGTFGKALDVRKHPLVPGYLSNPHVHSVNFSPLWDLFAVCDMGSDQIFMFKIEDDKLVPAGNTPLQLPKGFGPRYSVFHPTEPLLYVNCEHEPLLKVYRYDESGTLTETCAADALPEGMEKNPKFNPTDLSLSGDGTFLYALVRTADIVSVFRTDAEDGTLEMVQCYRLQGEGPRGCNLSPDGRFLAVANKLSGTVEILRVNGDGTLAPNSVVEDVSPGVVVFFET